MFSRRSTGADWPPESPSRIRRPFLRKSKTEQSTTEAAEGGILQQDKEATAITTSPENIGDDEPLPVTRNRLDTEDTLRMNNLNLPELLLDEDNPFLVCHESYSPAAVKMARHRFSREPEQEPEPVKLVDCASTVSSLSEGSFKQRPPLTVPAPTPAAPFMVAQPAALITPRTAPLAVQPTHVEQEEELKFVPPKVICFKVKMEVPDWLVEDDDSSDDKQQQHQVDSISRNNSLRTEDDETAENRPQPQLNYRRHHSQPPHWSPLPHSRVPHQYHFGPPPRSPQPQQRQPITPRGFPHPPPHYPQPMLPPPVWTGAPSPANTRPSMGRYKNASCYGNFPPRTPQPNTPTTVQAAFPLSPCNTVNLQDSQYNTTPSNRDRSRGSSLTPRGAALPAPPMTPQSMQLPLKKQSWLRENKEKHHKHKRNASAGDFSVLESLWTAPTAASSSHSLMIYHHHQQQQHASGDSAHAKRTSAVVQELRSMWSKMRSSSHRAQHPPDLVLTMDSSSIGSWNMVPRAAQGCLT